MEIAFSLERKKKLKLSVCKCESAVGAVLAQKRRGRRNRAGLRFHFGLVFRLPSSLPLLTSAHHVV